MVSNKSFDKTLLPVVIALAFIVWGFYPLFYGVFTGGNGQAQVNVAPQEAVLEDLPFITQITHSYQTGVHTYRGSVMVATQCHEVDAIPAISRSGSPERIVLSINTSEGVGDCEFNPILRPFELVVSADEDAKVDGVALDGEFVDILISESGS